MGIKPTTMSVAKALSSAYLPISAVIIPDSMYQAFVEASSDLGNFAHGFTYSGHPVCAAVALRNLELIEERQVFAHAAKMGEVFQSRLEEYAEHPLVGNSRGAGLIGAVELVADRETGKKFDAAHGVGAFCMDQCLEHGLIVRALGDTIAFCPPLIIDDKQIDELFGKFDQAVAATLAYASKLN